MEYLMKTLHYSTWILHLTLLSSTQISSELKCHLELDSGILEFAATIETFTLLHFGLSSLKQYYKSGNCKRLDSLNNQNLFASSKQRWRESSLDGTCVGGGETFTENKLREITRGKIWHCSLIYSWFLIYVGAHVLVLLC